MGVRVALGPEDDPDEYWIECDVFEGTGVASVPEDDQEPECDADGNEQYQSMGGRHVPSCDLSDR